MGIRLFGNGSSFSTEPPNPDPKLFTIRRLQRVGNLIVADIHYQGCTTHKGNKISVYREHADRPRLESRPSLDPHFNETRDAPIARFPGNDEGWDMAVILAQLLNRRDIMESKH